MLRRGEEPQPVALARPDEPGVDGLGVELEEALRLV